MTKQLGAMAALVALLCASEAHAATLYSINAAGYADTHLSNTVPFAVCLLGNPFNNGNNKLDTLLPSAPEGTEVYTWDGTNYDQFVFFSGAWLPPSGVALPTLAPGTGFWFHPPTPLPSNPYMISFVGEVPRGTFNLGVGGGYHIVSPPGGWVGYRSVNTLTGMGYPALDGDLSYIFHCDTVSFDVGAYYDGGWIGNYTIPIGQAFWIYKETAEVTWSQAVNIYGANDLTEPNLILSGWSRSGTTFRFSFPTALAKSYQVQSRMSPLGLWSNTGSAIPGTGNPATFTDSAATAITKVYRVAVTP